MKRAILAAVALFACETGVGHAQPVQRLQDALAAADANHDGRVTRPEFLASRTVRFSELDRNGDGYLTPADVAPVLRRRVDARLRVLLEKFDADHDGRISQAEFVSGSMRLFDQADTNHDGVVTQAEAQAEAARLRASSATTE